MNLYIAHFNFDVRKKEYGHFVATVQAEDVDSAFEQFRTLCRKITYNRKMFPEMETVYLDSCVEIPMDRIADPILCYFESIPLYGEDPPGSIYISAPLDNGMAVYHWGNPEEEDGTSGTCEPFIEIKRKKRKKVAVVSKDGIPGVLSERTDSDGICGFVFGIGHGCFLPIDHADTHKCWCLEGHEPA